MTFPRIAAALVALSLLAAACGAEDEPVVAGAPSSQNVIGLEYERFDGETASLEDFRGKPLVVNFFAQWCVNCVAEMPDFETVFKDLEGEVEFVGRSIDQAPADALNIIEITGVTFPTGWDPSEEVYRHFKALAMPTTVFVNANGEIQRVWSGGLSEEALREFITEELL